MTAVERRMQARKTAICGGLAGLLAASALVGFLIEDQGRTPVPKATVLRQSGPPPSTVDSQVSAPSTTIASDAYEAVDAVGQHISLRYLPAGLTHLPDRFDAGLDPGGSVAHQYEMLFQTSPGSTYEPSSAAVVMVNVMTLKPGVSPATVPAARAGQTAVDIGGQQGVAGMSGGWATVQFSPQPGLQVFVGGHGLSQTVVDTIAQGVRVQ